MPSASSATTYSRRGRPASSPHHEARLQASAPKSSRSWSASTARSCHRASRRRRGVTVAVVDSGIANTLPELEGRISSASTDVVVGRNTPYVASSSHGTRVSGVIASNFNGFGTIGVAYNSTILSIRADINECEDDENEFCFGSADLVRALDYAVANGARVINMSLGWDDPGVYELLQRGDTVGVFQLESEGMRKTLAAVRPTNFGDIIALVSLYRPGPMDNIPSFAARKWGREAPDYLHPMLEPILKPLWHAYAVMKRGRDRRQPLELDMPERKIQLRPDGTVDKVVIPERLDAHKLIEEMMIQANVAAAETLEKKKQPLVYRVHDAPTLSKQEVLREFLGTIGISMAKGVAMHCALAERFLEHGLD